MRTGCERPRVTIMLALLFFTLTLAWAAVTPRQDPCPPGQMLCDVAHQLCVDVLTSASHCGRCDNRVSKDSHPSNTSAPRACGATTACAGRSSASRPRSCAPRPAAPTSTRTPSTAGHAASSAPSARCARAACAPARARSARTPGSGARCALPWTRRSSAAPATTKCVPEERADPVPLDRDMPQGPVCPLLRIPRDELRRRVQEHLQRPGQLRGLRRQGMSRGGGLTQCPSGAGCESGQCMVPCPPGQRWCGDGCKNTENDNQHCGSCRNQVGVSRAWLISVRPGPTVSTGSATEFLPTGARRASCSAARTAPTPPTTTGTAARVGGR